MRDLYRVIAWDPFAEPGSVGHPLHVPLYRQGRGRIDNPDVYGVLYAADRPEGAIAEQFGWHPIWSPGMFKARDITTPWSYALCRFQLADDRILDLDDPRALLERALRPSRVVMREREITQGWARGIHAEQRWVGISWWSYYDPAWVSTGLWDLSSITLPDHPERLSPDHDAVRGATEILNKPWRWN